MVWKRLKKAVKKAWKKGVERRKKVVSKVKKVYKKADVAVGGRLPGGVTPKQAKAFKKPPVPSAKDRPAFEKEKAKAEEKVTRGLKTPTGGETKQSLEAKGFKKSFGAAPTYTKDGESFILSAGTLTPVLGGTAPIVGGLGVAGGAAGALKRLQDLKKLSVSIKAADALKGLKATAAAKTAAKAAATFKIPKVGQLGLDPKAKGVLSAVASNTKTAKIVTKWVFRVAGLLGLTTGAAGLYVSVVGTRVFTGFLGQEAIQTLGFGVRTAMENEDYEGVQAAIDLNKEVVTFMQSGEYKKGVPWDDALEVLGKFAEAASIKNSIDQQALDDKLIQIETGESDDEMWARIREEEAAQDKFNVDYYNSERKKMLAWEEEAADRDMAEDAAFWRKERRKQRKLEAADRKAIADFWLAYRKELQKIQDNNRPSNLNFGLL